MAPDLGRATRVGDTVRRPVYPWTPAVHDLLRHLESVGFPYSPRVLGIDGSGREILTYLDGDSGPAGWAHAATGTGLVAMARLLRAYHAAVDGYRAPPGLVVCHGDFGPWNLVWRDGVPVGILDWDLAHVAPPLSDVAYALEFVAPFRDDAECLRWLGYPAVPDRRQRLDAFATAYGLTTTDGLAEAVTAQQRATRERTESLAAQGIQPQATWVSEGYLAELDRRIAWSEEHRCLFD